MKKICISTEYINLGQFLKIVDLVKSGGETKIFLENNKILINHINDQRRGRKLYKGDVIEVLGENYVIC